MQKHSGRSSPSSRYLDNGVDVVKLSISCEDNVEDEDAIEDADEAVDLQVVDNLEKVDKEEDADDL